MQIIYLSPRQTFFVDIFAWVLIHLSVGFWCSRIPISKFDPQKKWYLTYPWEKGGEIYESIFHVRAWKKFVPSGGSLYPDTFSLQKLNNLRPEYLELWLKESCRAEFCHWVMMIPGFLFFLWNTVEVGWWMVVYAVVNNIFPIVMQRFNRPRVRRMISRVQRISLNANSLQPVLVYENEKEVLNSYC